MLENPSLKTSVCCQVSHAIRAPKGLQSHILMVLRVQARAPRHCSLQPNAGQNVHLGTFGAGDSTHTRRPSSWSFRVCASAKHGDTTQINPRPFCRRLQNELRIDASGDLCTSNNLIGERAASARVRGPDPAACGHALRSLPRSHTPHVKLARYRQTALTHLRRHDDKSALRAGPATTAPAQDTFALQRPDSNRSLCTQQCVEIKSCRDSCIPQTLMTSARRMKRLLATAVCNCQSLSQQRIESPPCRDKLADFVHILLLSPFVILD